ncbi:TIGR03752 family integrating conjugative element protein [Mannheimia haemolytica]|uniref:Integrating conjugative element protein, PFL_4705 family n=1 Tax=Mannheimia haemolytica TaxID=75985 RepID=A0A378NAC1_MANHA|nr:TIGR03752 family integrating conjugative element protein [Mannheimia haemolytica]TCS83673.1 integrating conjugative element protein (TIGR03752 family) [Mannheimia haemolytica]UQX71307.1 TIGR03752 family integrating conjugative element protein [Mannheimia haemolytica]STY52256.1 integrating conjugative element protein, PFL_4705 family [Mannheimia haemolytica]STY65360.1 integrating conjugative element protein, PFL_4705 family [Mannheimia haemolytica]
MKANKALFVILGIVFTLVGGIVYALFGRSEPVPQPTQQEILDISIKDLTPEQVRSMGIQGDSPIDTLRTLVTTVKSNERRMDALINEKDRQLKEKEEQIGGRINDAVNNETRKLQEQIADLKMQLFDMASQVSNKPVIQEQASTAEQNADIQGKKTPVATDKLPIGGASTLNSHNTDFNGMVWVEPSDQMGLDANGKPVSGNTIATKFGFPIDFKAGQYPGANAEKKGLPFFPETDTVTSQQGQAKGTGKNQVTPFYTVPSNSTFLDSVAMTGLIGRIPIDNRVSDAYPFKVLIGRENLIANGIELPDVEGAIVSGTATGDWTLSCVRGEVTSMTFVFNDGRIVSTSHKGSGNNSEKIGWLSDSSGIPCVPGERKTNAPEYLGTNFFLAAASAAAQGFSQSQTTTVVDGSSVVGAVTGDQGKFILGQAIGNGLKESADWFRKRFAENFDAVYVPPGHRVAIHIEKEIEIDYNPQGRKVKYGAKSFNTQLD